MNPKKGPQQDKYSFKRVLHDVLFCCATWCSTLIFEGRPAKKHATPLGVRQWMILRLQLHSEFRVTLTQDIPYFFYGPLTVHSVKQCPEITPTWFRLQVQTGKPTKPQQVTVPKPATASSAVCNSYLDCGALRLAAGQPCWVLCRNVRGRRNLQNVVASNTCRQNGHKVGSHFNWGKNGHKVGSPFNWDLPLRKCFTMVPPELHRAKRKRKQEKPTSPVYR